MRNPSKVIRCRDYRWQGVGLKAYKQEPVPCRDLTRQVLLGEGPGEEALNFITRYFEVLPGGYSTLEVHQHPHAVIVLRGSGQVVLGEETHSISLFDCVYVAPGARHQFRAAGGEPLGFLCVVDRVRDRPQPVE